MGKLCLRHNTFRWAGGVKWGGGTGQLLCSNMWAISSRHSAAVQRRVRCKCQCNMGLNGRSCRRRTLKMRQRMFDILMWWSLLDFLMHERNAMVLQETRPNQVELGTRGARTSEGTSRITHARKPFNRWTTNSPYRQVDWYNANTVYIGEYILSDRALTSRRSEGNYYKSPALIIFSLWFETENVLLLSGHTMMMIGSFKFAAPYQWKIVRRSSWNAKIVDRRLQAKPEIRISDINSLSRATLSNTAKVDMERAFPISYFTQSIWGEGIWWMAIVCEENEIKDRGD